ncbi:MAG: hypothetical protein HZA54_18090 [Planctomycetes bacterium]|nr:hypothetical protein [Planctomycetota bacterium]
MPTDSMVVYVAWHPDPPAGPDVSLGARLAREAYATWTRDPLRPIARGIGLPVYFRSASGGRRPLAISPDSARHTVLALLIDDRMVADPEWRAWAGETGEALLACPAHRVVCAALSPNAYQMDDRLRHLNFIRLHDRPLSEQLSYWRWGMTCELASALISESAPGSPPIRLFISHAKADGKELARALRDFVTAAEFPLHTFFDANDLTYDRPFAEEIERSARDRFTILVGIETDAFSARPWCQRELLASKEAGAAVVVVDALSRGEDRRFPYLGNVRTLRWEPTRPDDATAKAAIIEAALRELLAQTHALEILRRLRAEGLGPAAAALLPRAPELVTMLQEDVRRAAVVVYSDPPLPDAEIELVRRACAPGTLLTTPLQGLAQAKPLAGLRVVLSISEDLEGLAARGLGAEHVHDAWVEIARYLLAAGATLVYGGDLRVGGFTESLLQIAQAHRSEVGAAPAEAAVNLVSWDRASMIDPATEAAYARVARFERLELPADLRARFPDLLAASLDASLDSECIRARCYTAMRERGNALAQARLVLCGRTHGFRGRYPGILEETWLAIRQGLPTYVLGGFGGCAHAICAALQGRPDVMRQELRAVDAGRAALIDRFNLHFAAGSPIESEQVTADLARAGIPGLRNRLDEAANLELFATLSIPRMIRLVLEGLRGVAARGVPGAP